MSDSVISTERLTKRYGKTLAVDQVDLEVPAGRVFALMGPNGAGKSSIIKMLLGLESITGGRATALGLDCATQHVEIRQRVGYVPETHHMYPWMSIAEITRFTSAFYPTWRPALCASLLERFGLDPARKVRELSRGMVAKVALTLAMAHEPRLLVLDEPTNGLDAVVRKEFLESVVDVVAQEGRTVLISSHILQDLERVADCVALLDTSRLRFVEEAESLKSRVREIKITFDDGRPRDVDIPGAVMVRKGLHEWQAVVDNYDEGSLTRLRALLPGASLKARTLGLEEIFIALAGNHSSQS